MYMWESEVVFKTKLGKKKRGQKLEVLGGCHWEDIENRSGCGIITMPEILCLPQII